MKHAPAAAPVAQLLLAAALASGPGGCTGPSVPTVEWRTFVYENLPVGTVR